MNKADKARLDNDAIRTIYHTKVALPGRMIALRALIDTMYEEDNKKIAKKLLSKIKQVKTHTHKWKMFAHNDTHIHEQCICGDKNSRSATKQEQKEFKASLKELYSPKREHNVHYVWHEFCRKFMTFDKYGSSWKWLGHDLMSKVEKWAEKYPDEVSIAGVDDDHYMSSSLVFITHRTKIKYHGTTVIFIPQMGLTPSRYFMYPGHHDMVIDAMTKIKNNSKKLEVHGIKNGWSTLYKLVGKKHG